MSDRLDAFLRELETELAARAESIDDASTPTQILDAILDAISDAREAAAEVEAATVSRRHPLRRET